MSIEYLPVGIACNLKCTYCYQEPMRDAGNITTPRDWSAAQKALEGHNSHFTVFGGEPLLAPIEHLEEVFKFGFEKFGANGIQTNGTLITDAHIELFARYNVSVGISIDGPGELNNARPIGDLAATLLATNHVRVAIGKLCGRGIIPSIITTLHKVNADSIEKVSQLCAWFDELEDVGVRHVNLHILEVEQGMGHLALTDEENIRAFSLIKSFARTSRIRFEPFEDIRKLLTEESPLVSCIWGACDPFTTAAVQGVTPDGTRSNCGRTNKDGVNWVKADTPGSERYLLLHQVPQEHGGCKDCRFFIFCKGQCPGTAVDGDWRNRTIHCKVWYALFEMVERDIIAEARLPISRDPNTVKRLETKLLEKWTRGLGGDDNGHGDAHGDTPHGDSPHGDAHGDAPHQDHHGDSSKVTPRSGVEVTWR